MSRMIVVKGKPLDVARILADAGIPFAFSKFVGGNTVGAIGEQWTTMAEEFFAAHPELEARYAKLPRIEFDMRPWNFSHGPAAPRGRGSWAFDREPNGDIMKVRFSPGGMLFSEAKKWIEPIARAEKWERIYVLP